MKVWRTFHCATAISRSPKSPNRSAENIFYFLVVLMFAGDTQVVNDNVILALDWNGKSDNRVLESKNIVSTILRIF